MKFMLEEQLAAIEDRLGADLSAEERSELEDEHTEVQGQLEELSNDVLLSI